MLVERKEVRWRWTGFHGRSLIEMMEMRKKRSVRGLFTKESIMWMAAVLRRFAREQEGEDQSRVAAAGGENGNRWRDHHGTVTVAVCENTSGRLLKIEMILVGSKGKKIIFCLPAGKNGGGWLAMAVEMASLAGVRITTSHGGRSVPARRAEKPVTYVEALRGKEKIVAAENDGKRMIKVCYSFVYGNDGWENLEEKIIMVRKWVEVSEGTVGKCSSKWEDKDAVLEVVVSDLVTVEDGEAVAGEDSPGGGQLLDSQNDSKSIDQGRQDEADLNFKLAMEEVPRGGPGEVLGGPSQQVNFNQAESNLSTKLDSVSPSQQLNQVESDSTSQAREMEDVTIANASRDKEATPDVDTTHQRAGQVPGAGPDPSSLEAHENLKEARDLDPAAGTNTSICDPAVTIRTDENNENHRESSTAGQDPLHDSNGIHDSGEVKGCAREESQDLSASGAQREGDNQGCDAGLSSAVKGSEIFLFSKFLHQFQKNKKRKMGEGGSLHLGRSRILDLERKKRGLKPEQKVVKRKLGLIKDISGLLGEQDCSETDRVEPCTGVS